MELESRNYALKKVLEKEQGFRDELATKSELVNRKEKRIFDLQGGLETIGEN